ncbi:MAG: ExeM/NucH family extracellular endonuclease [Anaerolineaceae bacterium]|nr:ExeM/NucH family extracellular endonuclease [Anaerolineaceae bacterium]
MKTKIGFVNLLMASVLAFTAILGGIMPQQIVQAATTELFFSEYIEGSSNNKALEIYNGTGSAIDLTTGEYKIQMFFNGSASAGLTINLVGTVAAGDVFVIAQSSANATILAQADQTNGAGWYNGDDAVVLRKGTDIIDSIGQIGFDPGSQWGSDLTSTADNTLRRKITICAGDPDGSDAFVPSIEWDGYATDTSDGLGSHTANCGDNSPIISTCPTNIKTFEGYSAGDLFTAYDEDGIVVNASITNLVDSGISIVNLTGATEIGAELSGILFVDETTSSGNHTVEILFQNNDTPAQSSTCSVQVVVIPPICPVQDTHSIGQIQGETDISPYNNQFVTTSGVVVGDFQDLASGYKGYYIQDLNGDGNENTSDGIFVYNTYYSVDVGDPIQFKAKVSEYNGKTQLSSISSFTFCGVQQELVPTPISLPVAEVPDFEKYEGMLVAFPQELVISEYFNFDRYGEIVLTTDRYLTPTAEYEPGSPEYLAAVEKFKRNRILLDDGRTTQNPDPAVHPNWYIFNMDNLFRGGDTVTNITGIMDYGFSEYRIQPVQGADYNNTNPRPKDPDDVGGDIKVASFNVLNYFTTLGSRGADDPLEFERQRAKIIAAITAINADVVGLMEIENNDAAIMDLVAGLNELMGAGTYAYVDTGVIGTDEIKVAMIFKPSTVDLYGNYAILDSSVDPRFLDDLNRPTLAQSFQDNTNGGVFTVAVNHLKSKGSSCEDVGDPDLGDGAGNCNLTRKAAAEAMVDWLANDPTGSGSNNYLIIGDLNSYDKEDPIDAILAGPDDVLGTDDDYTDLLFHYIGENAYTYVFDGQIGYLDHGLVNSDLMQMVTGTTVWHINADEPDLIDYDMSFKLPAQDALYAPDPFRSSDHDPVIIGLKVCELVPPTVTVSVTPDTLWSPNHKYVEVVATVDATDNWDPNPTVELISVTSNEPDNGEDDGNTVDDIVIVDNYHFLLRAERSDLGSGRIYTITYKVMDACGNFTIQSATVFVPISQGK